MLAKVNMRKDLIMLREELSNTLKSAMLAHDSQTVAAVRLIIAGQKEKDVEARGKGNQQATDAELLSMMQSMIKQRRESIKMYVDANRDDLAQKEQAEIEVIERFLPKQMNDEEMLLAIKETVNLLQANSMKEMGKVMAALKEKYAGQMDFSKASGTIKSLLG